MAGRNLPVRQYSLPEFCHLMGEVEQEDRDAFITLAISGIYQRSQVVVDPIRDRLTDLHTTSATRDYDSMLGLHRDCIVDSHLTLFPSCHGWDHLDKKIHINHTFRNEFGSHDIPLHKIPNIFVGKWNLHNTLRVFIPGLYNKDRKSSALSVREMETFYNQGFYPAVRDLLGQRGMEWPPDYRSEIFRGTNAASSRNTIQTKMFSKWVVPELMNTIRSHLAINHVPWSDGILMYHQIQGTKNSSTHSVDVDSASQALDAFLFENSLPRDKLGEGDWYIDVGLEVSSDLEECLAWRSDYHWGVVAAITHIPENESERITTLGSSQYVRDMVSHMPAISGCRIVPGKRAHGPMNVRYLQLYTTDKSITARKSGAHHGNYITGPDILQGKCDKYLNGLYETYRQAARINVSHARAEVRVPLQKCLEPFIDLDYDAMRSGLVSFPPSVWWGLRAYRCLAMAHLTMDHIQADPDFRVKPSALLLAAAVPWFLNSLHCTPDTRRASRNLLDAILPHVSRADGDANILPYIISSRSRVENEDLNEGIDSEDNTSDDESNTTGVLNTVRPTAETVPAIPYGIVFLRKTRHSKEYPCPRFNNHDGTASFLSERTFAIIFGQKFQEAVLEILQRKMKRQNPVLIPNKGHHTPRYQPPNDQPLESAFDLHRKGIAFKPPPVDAGSDAESEVELGNADSDGVESLVDGNIDMVLTQLWFQFLADITAKSPNRRGGFSYCKLSKEERKVVTEETYRNQDLSLYFRDCQWKVASDSEWVKSFDYLWPTEPPSGKTQNYEQCSYMTTWLTVLSRSNVNALGKIRKALKKKFDSLYWMPQAEADRIWYTKIGKGFSKSSEYDKNLAAPRILINPNTGLLTKDRPSWTQSAFE